MKDHKTSGWTLYFYPFISHDHPIYGVGVMGKLWHFLVLQGQDYCVSKSFATDDEEIFEVVKILKALKAILFDIAKLDA